MAAQIREALLRPLSKGCAGPEDAERADLCDRRKPVGGEPALADGYAEAAVPHRRLWREFRSAGIERTRRLCIRPVEAGPVHPAPDQHGRREPVEAVACARPAL